MLSCRGPPWARGGGACCWQPGGWGAPEAEPLGAQEVRILKGWLLFELLVRRLLAAGFLLCEQS